MKTPDGTILMHGTAPYDPAKAHDYYVRTRQLKGRRKGQTTFAVKGRHGGTVQLTRQQLVEQQAYAAKRVAEIKSKLSDLRHDLEKRMAEARKADAKAKKGPTAADKREAAKESKKYQDKHKQQLANKRKRAAAKKPAADHKKKTSSVAELKTQIDEVKSNLKAAVERQRSLSSATKNG
jgi:hypothetical protein